MSGITFRFVLFLWRSCMMAKQSKLSRLSSLVSTAGFIVDGYNGLKYSAKIKI